MGPFQDKMRRARMRQFFEMLNPAPGTRILDLGGTPHIWQTATDIPLEITIANLPGINAPGSKTFGPHTFHFIDADATNMATFDDNAFDIVFSNSVIEHVGDRDKISAFSQEVRRLAPNYWVQTPSIWFPIEAHTGVPFWFRLPQSIRQKMIERWRKKLPGWTRMVETTTVLKRQDLVSVLPDAAIITERLLGIPKSYIAARKI